MEKKKRRIKEIEEIKKNRLMMSLFNGYYEDELNNDANESKKIDCQQVTRCSFEMLAYLIRETEKLNIKNKTSEEFAMRIIYKSNINEPEVMRGLRKLYNFKKKKKYRHRDIEKIIDSVKFISCKLSKDKSHSIWIFDWIINESRIKYIWVKNAYRRGTWASVNIGGNTSSSSRKRKREEINNSTTNTTYSFL